MISNGEVLSLDPSGEPAYMEEGVPQGKPTSTHWISIAAHPALQAIVEDLAATRQADDDMGIVVASHDDFVIVAEPSRVMSALAVAQDSFASKGLALQSAKTKVAAFNPQVLQQCKQALHERRQTNLPHFGPANEEEEDGFWNEGIVFYGCAIGTPNFIEIIYSLRWKRSGMAQARHHCYKPL